LRSAQQYIEQVKTRNPVEEVIGQEVQLHKEGVRLRGACPLHGDTAPSLVVYPENGTWWCFGCNQGGDVFSWAQFRHNLDFWGACDLLAERKGIERRQVSAGERAALEAAQVERRQLREVLTEAGRFYAAQLWQPLGEPARAYLSNRGFTEATLKAFVVGFAAGGVSAQGHLRQKGYSQEIIAKAGLLGRPRPSDGLQQDFFWQRVIFPVYDGGSVSNLYGRSIDPEGKPAHLYLAGKNSGLFNWDEASRHREVFLTEGIIDALSLHQAGFHNVIASYGTAGFKEEFALRLKRAGVERVYLTFDSDADEKKSGQAAALRVSALLASLGMEPRIVDLGPKDDPQIKLDPNDYFKNHTGEDFRTLVNSARTPPDYKQLWKLETAEPLLEVRGIQLVFRAGPREYQIQNVENPDEGFRANVTLLCNGILVHKDRVSFWSARSRSGFAKKAVGQVAAEVERDLLGIDSELSAYTKKRLAADEAAAGAALEMSDEERVEALELLSDPNLLKHVVDDLSRLGYVGEDGNKIMVYLIATSRKLDKPMSAIAKGQSSAGKSDLIKKVIRLMPSEDVVDFSRVTPQALFYMGRDALKHRFVVIMERSGSEEADYPIRTMQSERVLRLAIPVKNPQTGLMETKTIEVEGPMAYMESTTQPRINAENATRAFDLYVNEQSGQTQKIHDAQREARTEAALVAELEQERICRRHQNAQRLLENLRVLIPWAPLLTFPVDQVRTRRDHDRFLDLIACVAFLHQYQREKKAWDQNPDVRYIEANLFDYGIAFGLAREVLTQTLDELPRPSRELLVEIKAMVEDMARKRGVTDLTKIEFTRRDVRRWVSYSEFFVRKHVELLADMGYLESTGGNQGRTVKYSWAHEGDVTRPEVKGLLTPAQLAQLLDAWDDGKLIPMRTRPGTSQKEGAR
jgi:DNA primase catalytic core